MGKLGNIPLKKGKKKEKKSGDINIMSGSIFHLVDNFISLLLIQCNLLSQVFGIFFFFKFYNYDF